MEVIINEWERVRGHFIFIIYIVFLKKKKKKKKKLIFCFNIINVKIY